MALQRCAWSRITVKGPVEAQKNGTQLEYRMALADLLCEKFQLGTNKGLRLTAKPSKLPGLLGLFLRVTCMFPFYNAWYNGPTTIEDVRELVIRNGFIGQTTREMMEKSPGKYISTLIGLYSGLEVTADDDLNNKVLMGIPRVPGFFPAGPVGPNGGAVPPNMIDKLLIQPAHMLATFVMRQAAFSGAHERDFRIHSGAKKVSKFYDTFFRCALNLLIKIYNRYGPILPVPQTSKYGGKLSTFGRLMTHNLFEEESVVEQKIPHPKKTPTFGDIDLHSDDDNDSASQQQFVDSEANEDGAATAKRQSKNEIPLDESEKRCVFEETRENGLVSNVPTFVAILVFLLALEW